MAGFWLIIEIAAYVATTVLTMYLASKANQAKASALGDFTAPTAEEGRVIPVVFGTVKLAAPNVVWYGDLKARAIKKGFIFKATTGFHYYMGMDLMLCHGPVDTLEALSSVGSLAAKCAGDGLISNLVGYPWTYAIDVVCAAIDANHFSVTQAKSGQLSTATVGNLGTATVGVTFNSWVCSFLISQGATTPFQPGDQFSFTVSSPSAIYAQDKACPYSSSVVEADGQEDYISLYLNGLNLFGGDQQQGGLEGQVDFYRGLQTSFPNAYLSANLPGANPAPAYRGLCHVVCEQLYVGTQNTLQLMAFVVKRCPDPLAQGPANANLGGDANPAWIIWDIMTNTIYGLGIPSARFDQVSFIAASVTLKNESMGMSMQTDSEGSADTLITEVLRHIDGVLYTDPSTGLWTLKLVRADYDVTTLVTVDESNMLEPPEFNRLTWDETLNEIKVRYCDRSMYFTPRLAQAQETANMATRGQLASDTSDFTGFSNVTIAQFVAARELKSHSYPLARIKIKTNRVAWNFRIGGVFLFSYAALGLAKVVFRISSINYGLLERGEIEMGAVEDVFAVTSAGYTPIQSGGGWGDPTPGGPPPPPLAQELMESPYLINNSPQRFVFLLAARGDNLSLGCDVDSEVGGAALALTNTDQPFIPYGVLRDAYPAKTPPEDSVGFVLASGVDLDSLVSASLNLFVIDDEVMSFTTVVLNPNGTAAFTGILRGLLDTVPADHAEGAAVWFFGEGAAYVQPGQYAADVTIGAKAIPANIYGSADPASVTQVNLATASRAQSPYPPGDVLVNGVWVPASTLGDVLVTWADRHRVNQGQNIVRQDDPSWTGGVEGNYHIVVTMGGLPFADLPGQSGNSYAGITLAARLGVAASGPVVFQITPVNGALVGKTRTLTFWMSGFGMCFGMIFGGKQA